MLVCCYSFGLLVARFVVLFRFVVCLVCCFCWFVVFVLVCCLYLFVVFVGLQLTHAPHPPAQHIIPSGTSSSLQRWQAGV